MRPLPFLLCASLSLVPPAHAWSPRFHETQSALAVGLVPRAMATYLRAHPDELLGGSRGQGNTEVPSVEDVEEQFRKILKLSEEKRRSGQIVRELGVLANLVQLLADPSATQGSTALRERFEAYGNEHLARLVVTREPFWAVTAPLDPRPHLVALYQEKYERHRSLSAHFNAETSQPLGPWDFLSVPFAHLQLSFSGGVNATANFWIQAYRATGDLWDLPPEPPPPEPKAAPTTVLIGPGTTPLSPGPRSLTASPLKASPRMASPSKTDPRPALNPK